MFVCQREKTALPSVSSLLATMLFTHEPFNGNTFGSHLSASVTGEGPGASVDLELK